MLRHDILRDLDEAPTGPPLSLPQASCALSLSPARVAALVRDGVLPGRVEDGQVIAIERRAIRRLLDPRTRDRAVLR